MTKSCQNTQSVVVEVFAEGAGVTQDVDVTTARTHRASRSRLVVVIVAALSCFAFISFVFWNEDLKYSLPTPRPVDLVQLPVGAEWHFGAWSSALNLSESLGEPSAARPPVLFNFFNPACSCSRFNLTHLRGLQAKYGDKVRFVAVIQSLEDASATKERLKALDLNMPYVLDNSGAIAAEVGVYSTPQAVLVDRGSRILYRGNYNLSRYCTDPNTEYVRIALEALVRAESVVLPEDPAYGCELPSAVAAK